jgi:hypothetical protein
MIYFLLGLLIGFMLGQENYKQRLRKIMNRINVPKRSWTK